jgi:DNA mismatch endonuclease (patch repair protein)
MRRPDSRCGIRNQDAASQSSVKVSEQEAGAAVRMSAAVELFELGNVLLRVISRALGGSISGRRVQSRSRSFVVPCQTMVENAPPQSAKSTCVSYRGRRPASPRASAAGRGSSKKVDTKCERVLRKALWAAGYRYRKNVAGLPGHPDIVFLRARVAVFCDGDFWHGRDWERRRERLQAGFNPEYWLAKIQRNMERDRETTFLLERTGWTVLRFWESEIRSAPPEVAQKIGSVVDAALDNGSKMP